MNAHEDAPRSKPGTAAPERRQLPVARIAAQTDRLTRRDALRAGSFLLAGAALARPSFGQSAPDRQAPVDQSGIDDASKSGKNPTIAPDAEDVSRHMAAGGVPHLEPGRPGRDYTPVITPGGSTLPWKVVDGVKVFHLVCTEHEHEFAPGLKCICWGYNGRTHGPTIEAVEGDRVRIYVTNTLAAPTTVHWHGVLLPSGMDGVGGVSQRAIHQGETFHYEFTLRQHGTCMYHAHHDEMTQMGMGMMGMFIIHPRADQPNPTTLPSEHGPRPRPDREFAIMLSEWAVTPGTRRPNPNEMTDFNILTMNGKAFPGTAPLVVRKGQRVRIRIGNLSAMDHHPIHLHGYNFKIVATDGGDVHPFGQQPETTVLVPVGSTRDVEFVAGVEGDWVMHCHMTHHVMNQMGHGIPNMIGMNPHGMDQQVQRIIPAYMTMGQEGMGDMGDMGMAVPKNSIPMVGGYGPFDYITMGGMFTILKVRARVDDDALAANADPGWYANPPGTVATLAQGSALSRDGIDVSAAGLKAAMVDGDDRGQSAVLKTSENPPTASGVDAQLKPVGVPQGDPSAAGGATRYTCPMHPEVVSDRPGKCPKCGMRLVERK